MAWKKNYKSRAKRLSEAMEPLEQIRESADELSGLLGGLVEGLKDRDEKFGVPDALAHCLTIVNDTPVEDAKGVVSELKEEIESWLENLPENLKSGSKADELNDCVSALEAVESSLDEIDCGLDMSVIFDGDKVVEQLTKENADAVDELSSELAELAVTVGDAIDSIDDVEFPKAF